MASERIQRQIERLPGEVDEALAKLDWKAVRDRAQAVLALYRDNKDALSFLDSAVMLQNAEVRRGASPSQVR